VTAALGVYSPSPLDDKFEPAYCEEFLRLLQDEYDVELDDEETLPTPSIPAAEVPADLDIEQAHDIRTNLRQQAREDAIEDPPKRTVGYSDWKQSLYDALLHDELDSDVELEELETIETEEEDDETTEDNEATEDNETPPSIAEDSEAEGPEVASSEESEESEESGDSYTSDHVAEQTELSSGSDTSTAQSVTDDDEALDTTQGRELELTDEEWETLVEALGLEEDASTEEVRERLFQTMDTLRSLPA
jgi:hypothetical protein